MRKRHFLILMLVIAGVGLSACTRPASTAPGPTSTPFEDPILSVYSRTATEAALAATEGTGGGEGVATPITTVAAPTATESIVSTATPTLEPTAGATEPVTVPQEYTLKKGEFPYCIARRFDIDVDQLLTANGLSRGGLYYPGLTLTIPQSASAFAGERALLSHPTTYNVVSGDTFYSIACKYGDVYPESIAQANSMTIDETLTAGTSLQIP